MQKVNYNKSLGSKLKVANIPDVKIPNWANRILKETVTDKGFTLEGQTIANGRILNKGFRMLDQSQFYLRERTNKYEKEIRQSQAILKRKNLKPETIKKHQKLISDREKKIANIENTRQKRSEQAKAKVQKIAKQAQLKMIEINQQKGINIDAGYIDDVLNDITEIDNALLMGAGNISSFIIKLEQNIAIMFGDSNGVKLQQSKLCTDLIKHLKGMQNKLTNDKIDIVTDKCMDVLDRWYNKYFANHGYNTQGQFIIAQLAKGFKNSELINEIMEAINSEV